MTAQDEEGVGQSAAPAVVRESCACAPRERPIRIRSLGGFRLDAAGQAIDAASTKRSTKPLQLLQVLLALNPDGANPRVLADTLWPDADADAAYHAFEVTLQRLRRLLGHSDALLLRAGSLRLNRGICWVDLWTLDEVLRQLDVGVSPDDPQGLAFRLLQCHRGEFLPGVDAGWVLTARARITGRFTRAVELLGVLIESRAGPPAVIDLYRRALEAEPLAEGLYRRCMGALVACNRQAEALAVYRLCAEQLRVRFGSEPSAATRELVDGLGRMSL